MIYGFKDKIVAERLKRATRASSLPLPSEEGLHYKVEDLVHFYNGSEEEIHSGGIMQCVSETFDEETNDLFTVIQKPTKLWTPLGFLVNICNIGEVVDPGAMGWAVRAEKAAWCLAHIEGDPDDFSVEAGQLWGPKDDWELHKNFLGFISTGATQPYSDTSNLIRCFQSVPTFKVQCWNSDGDTAGKLIDVNTDKILPGRVVAYDGSTTPVKFGPTEKPDCWIKFIDFFDDDKASNNGPLGVHSRYYDGFAAGYLTSGGTDRALFLTHAGEQVFLAKIPTTDAPKGTTAKTFHLYNRDRTDSSITRDALPLGSLIHHDKWATVKRFDDGAWYVGCWE